MNRLEFTAKKSMLERELAPLQRAICSCSHCEHFNPNSKVCNVFADTPPAHAVTQDIGCESWAYDNIPW